MQHTSGVGVLNRPGPAHLTFGYRFRIRHEIHSGLQLLVLFFFCLFVCGFLSSLSISSTYREKKNQLKKRIEAKGYHKSKTEPKVTGSL